MFTYVTLFDVKMNMFPTKLVMVDWYLCWGITMASFLRSSINSSQIWYRWPFPQLSHVYTTLHFSCNGPGAVSDGPTHPGLSDTLFPGLSWNMQRRLQHITLCKIHIWNFNQTFLWCHYQTFTVDISLPYRWSSTIDDIPNNDWI